MTYIIYLWAMEELFTALLPRNFDKRIISHPLELKPLSQIFIFSVSLPKHDLKKSSWLVGWSVSRSVGQTLEQI